MFAPLRHGSRLRGHTSEAAYVLALMGDFLREAGPGPGLAALGVGLSGDPASVFGSLPAANDPREREARRQAGLAVRIYRELARRTSEGVARKAMRPLVAAGGVAYLAHALRELWPDALRETSAAALPARVRSWLDRFATATAELVSATPEGVVFEVHACALVRLCAAAGHPELAPLFCASDAAFFPHRGLRLHRPSTLADGGTCCRFELTPAS